MNQLYLHYRTLDQGKSHVVRRGQPMVRHVFSVHLTYRVQTVETGRRFLNPRARFYCVTMGKWLQVLCVGFLNWKVEINNFLSQSMGHYWGVITQYRNSFCGNTVSSLPCMLEGSSASPQLRALEVVEVHPIRYSCLTQKPAAAGE